MKLVIGVYDRILSHNLSIILSGKKIAPIEAEAMEEIPALLERHPGAMLLCEETDAAFYERLYQKNNNMDIYLLVHPSLSATSLLQLKKFGIKAVIPYSEDPNEIIEVIIQQLSILASEMKKDDQSLVALSNKEHRDTAVHLPISKKWAYGELQGFNSSKVAVTFSDPDICSRILEEHGNNEFLMYLKGLNIRMYTDFMYTQNNIFVFRYRKMSSSDANRLAYYIHYCRQQAEAENMSMK
ncbi:MAG: hypothetical protein ACRCTQ_03385 [Brevinemataceae bacterium]